jgi:hypothetical protein
MSASCVACNDQSKPLSSGWCSLCTLLRRPLLGISADTEPSLADRVEAKALLAESEGMPDDTRWHMLAKQIADRVPTITALFERRLAVDWGASNRDEWRQFIEDWQPRAQGKRANALPQVPNISVNFPSYGTLSRREKDQFIQEVRLLGPLPIADVADWLSNGAEARPRAYEDWNEALGMMSACTWPVNGIIDSEWMVDNTLPGIPFPGGLNPAAIEQLDVESFVLSTLDQPQHPFWNWVCTQISSKADLSTALLVGKIGEELWAEIARCGGELTDLWRTALKDWQTIHNAPIQPALVVKDDRLHLLTVKDGSFHPTPIPPSPRVWNVLVACLMSPPGSEPARLLAALRWCWNDDDTSLVPDERQMRGLSMLRQVCSSHAERVSTLNDGGGILIQGDSGMCYKVYTRESLMGRRALKVIAFRHRAAYDKGEDGMPVCIEANDLSTSPLPLGDYAASFVLGLLSDVIMAQKVATLRLLHAEWNRAPRHDSRRWRELIDKYPMGIALEEADEEDYDDEYWDDEDCEESWDE